jgi:hypothetical protein
MIFGASRCVFRSVAPTATVVFLEVPVVSDADLPSPFQPSKTLLAGSHLTFSASASGRHQASISAMERGLVFLTDRRPWRGSPDFLPAASVMRRTIGSGGIGENEGRRAETQGAASAIGSSFMETPS